MRRQRFGPERGFSLIELLVIGALVGILALFTVPAIGRFTQRAKMRGSAQALAAKIQRARLTSIQNNQNVVVETSPDGRALLIWADVNGPIDGDPPDLVFNPIEGKNRLETDHMVDTVPLDTNVFFGGPNGQGATSGLTALDSRTALLLFPSGSAADPGSFNLGFTVGSGVSSNYLQVFISPAATARTVLRKWDPVAGQWRAQREAGKAWEWTTP